MGLTMATRFLAGSAAPLLFAQGEPAPPSDLSGVVVEGLPGCDFYTGRITAACIPSFIGHVVVFAFGMIGAFFIVNIMIAGYQMALGGVNQDYKTKGKERLIWSLIGFALTACSFLIVDMIFTVAIGVM